MKIGALKETQAGECRVALTPASAQKLQKLGHHCFIQSGAGVKAQFSDDAYHQSGTTVLADADTLWHEAEIIITLNPPSIGDRTAAGKTLIGFINPAENAALLEQFVQAKLTIIAMDQVPRISRAQKLDALSSMANIAGYRGTIEAASHFGRFFTGQITAAGKIPPARVLVIGTGVAGLAAIATARSLGAIVRAFDVRRETAEQIESMGAEFLVLDFDEDASGSGGYAAPSSEAFRNAQLACFRNQAAEIDIVITTALIPGRPAPQLWLDDMVAAMQPGSVVLDLAAERGGNCSLTRSGQLYTTPHGVTIIGYHDFPSRMATQSSLLYATNIRNMIAELTPNSDGCIVHNMEDVVIRGATVVYQGTLTYPPPKLKPAIATPPAPAKIAPVDPPQQRHTALIQIGLLVASVAFIFLIGTFAPPSFMQHFIVFVLAVFVGYQVVWNVSHALHTPLMSVTNAISGVVIVGALLQINAPTTIAKTLAAIAILITTINIVGGFMVTQRMLRMFRKS